MNIVDYRDKRPTYLQIVHYFENLILQESLKQGDKLPPVRNLAVQLSINPNTIQKAYSMLESRGMIYSVQGVGSFVNELDTEFLKKSVVNEEIAKLFDLSQKYGIKEEDLIKLIRDFVKTHLKSTEEERGDNL